MSEKKPNTRLTADEYLEMEATAGTRHEFIEGQIFAMTGASDAHNIICMNLGTKLHVHLDGSGCHAYMNDMKFRLDAAHSFYYPDIFVTCEPVSPKSVFKSAPVLIVEVLSPSTQQIDRREKLVAYRKAASVREYLIIHQNRILLELYRKQPDGGWSLTHLEKPDTLTLNSLPDKPLVIPVAAIYKDVDLPMTVNEEEAEYEAAF